MDHFFSQSIYYIEGPTGGPLIGRKNGSIFLTNHLMRTVNKIAVLWEELENLLNKPKPSYREIRPMRGRLMRGPPVIEKGCLCGISVERVILCTITIVSKKVQGSKL